MKPNYVLKPAMQTLHITKLRKHQRKPIQLICKGQDTVILAATSAGKSAIHQLPTLTQPALTLVVEPARRTRKRRMDSLSFLSAANFLYENAGFLIASSAAI